MNRLAFALSILLLTATLVAQTTSSSDSMKDCPMHNEHAGHHALVEQHGDQAMGFPYDKTTHHFLITSDGGTIEVRANDASDKTNTAAIRSHLAHIASVFASGDFSAPMFIHDGVPPGVTTMKLMKASIGYAYDEIPSGGRVRITSADPIAVAAIHDFLRFQITEHQTGDRLEMPQN